MSDRRTLMWGKFIEFLENCWSVVKLCFLLGGGYSALIGLLSCFVLAWYWELWGAWNAFKYRCTSNSSSVAESRIVPDPQLRQGESGLGVWDLVVKADGGTGFWTCHLKNFQGLSASDLDLALREMCKWCANDRVWGVDHLVLPVNIKIHILFTTSSEVGYWFFPELLVSAIVVPESVHRVTLVGVREGLHQGVRCTTGERGASFATASVKFVSMSDFKKWISTNSGLAG